MKKPLILSLLAHCLLLALFLNQSQKSDGGNGNSNTGNETGEGNGALIGQDRGEILPPPTVKVMEVTPEVQKEIEKQKDAMELAEKKNKPEQKASPAPDGCITWFGGIGVSIDPVSGYIHEVYPGYPAYESGLRSGDVILEISSEIQGEVGTPLTMIIQRGADQYRLTLIRAKICSTK